MRNLVTLVKLSLSVTALLLHQVMLIAPTQAQTEEAVELAGSAFKNVTALAEMPANQMGKVMNIMSASLGVNCQFCHEGFDFAKEHVAHKDIGRKMIEMTLELNQKHFEERPQVTCFTCHRGQRNPATTVTTTAASVELQVTQPEHKPSEEAILSRYIEAIGGEEKLGLIKSRHTVAKRIEPDGRSEPEELWQSADGTHRLVTTYKTAVVTELFDGKTASKKANETVIQLKVDEALQIEREAQMAFGRDFKRVFSSLKFVRIEQIEGRRVFVLEAIFRNQIRERLYFDEQTNFLSRRTAAIATVLGDFTYQVDYRNYRSFDGIHLPTEIQYLVPNISWTREVTAVEHTYK